MGLAKERAMIRVNMHEAKSQLSKLVELLPGGLGRTQPAAAGRAQGRLANGTHTN
jgi:hypothetical protein